MKIPDLGSGSCISLCAPGTPLTYSEVTVEFSPHPQFVDVGYEEITVATFPISNFP